jgi:hypothetical protein
MPPSTNDSLVESLQPLMRMRKPSLTLGEMVDKIETDDGPGPVLFVLTLPVLLPLPPGVSMLLALPLLIVAPQIALERPLLWLPQMLKRRSLKRRDLVGVLRRALPWLRRFERVIHPRLTFLTGRIGARFVGAACTLIALVLVLPIPFANLVPSIAMSVFALGLTRRDGLLVLGGYGLIALAVAVIWLGVHGVSLGWNQLRAMI